MKEHLLKFVRAIGLTIASLGLFVVSYILIGGGFQLDNLTVIVLGMPIYFVSLYTAKRSRMGWLLGLIAGLGVIFGLFDLLVCFTQLLRNPHHPRFALDILHTGA